MGLEQIYFATQIVAVFVLIGSVIYLAHQVRQNTNALYAESRQVLLESSLSDLKLQFDNPDVALTMWKPLPLTVEEQIRLDTFWAADLRTREVAWLQYKHGVIDSDLFETELTIIGVVFDCSRARLWWNEVGRQYFSAEFVEFVDDEIKKSPATDTIWEASANWANG